jgi:hypothetical protein
MIFQSHNNSQQHTKSKGIIIIIMTSIAVTIPNFYNKSPVVSDHDHVHDLNSMIDLDDVFSDVFTSLEHNYLEAVDQQEHPAAYNNSFAMTPNPLQNNNTVFVPAVSPPSSDAGLSEWDDVEPTTLAEMRGTARSVSPSTTRSTDSTQPIPFAANSSITKKIVKKRSNNPKKRPRPPKEEDEAKVEELQRRERNRQHAKKSRQRKKSFTQDLEQSLTDLKEENTKLREQICAAIGNTKTESMLQTRLANPAPAAEQRFIACLKQPEHRVVDADTLTFLQSLKKEIPSIHHDPLGTAA